MTDPPEHYCRRACFSGPNMESSQVSEESDGSDRDEISSAPESPEVPASRFLPGVDHVVWTGGRPIQISSRRSCLAEPSSAASVSEPGSHPPGAAGSPARTISLPGLESPQALFPDDPRPPGTEEDAAPPTPGANLVQGLQGRQAIQELLRSSRLQASILSVGSILHATQECRPCFYAHTRNGCRFGAACLFCHEAHPRKKKPRPPKHVRLDCKQAARAAFQEMVGTPFPEAESLLRQQSQDENTSKYAVAGHPPAVLRALYKGQAEPPMAPASDDAAPSVFRPGNGGATSSTTVPSAVPAKEMHYSAAAAWLDGAAWPPQAEPRRSQEVTPPERCSVHGPPPQEPTSGSRQGDSDASPHAWVPGSSSASSPPWRSAPEERCRFTKADRPQHTGWHAPTAQPSSRRSHQEFPSPLGPPPAFLVARSGFRARSQAALQRRRSKELRNLEARQARHQQQNAAAAAAAAAAQKGGLPLPREWPYWEDHHAAARHASVGKSGGGYSKAAQNFEGVHRLQRGASCSSASRPFPAQPSKGGYHSIPAPPFQGGYHGGFWPAGASPPGVVAPRHSLWPPAQPEAGWQVRHPDAHDGPILPGAAPLYSLYGGAHDHMGAGRSWLDL